MEVPESRGLTPEPNASWNGKSPGKFLLPLLVDGWPGLLWWWWCPCGGGLQGVQPLLSLAPLRPIPCCASLRLLFLSELTGCINDHLAVSETMCDTGLWLATQSAKVVRGLTERVKMVLRPGGPCHDMSEYGLVIRVTLLQGLGKGLYDLLDFAEVDEDDLDSGNVVWKQE